MNEMKYGEYKPSKAVQMFIASIEEKYTKAYRQRSRGYRHMDDLSPNDFWKQSRDQFNGYVPQERITLKKWHSRIFRKKTRKKVIASCASLISSGIGVDISALKPDNSFDRQLSNITSTLVDWAAEQELQEGVLLRAVVEAFVVGTAFVYDSIVWDMREVKEIVDIDMENGRVETEKATITDFKGAKSELIRIEEMYLGDIFQHDIQKQPYIIRRRTTDYDTASVWLKKYPNWKKVIPDSKMFFGTDYEDRKEQQEDFDNRVEIVEFWCKHNDTFAIVCNGVLLTDKDMGFPYPHKRYPFSKFSPFLFADSSFAYGDSLAHINIGEQTTINELTNIMIDSEKLKNKPPVVTTYDELANSDIVIPGAMVHIRQGEEVKILDAFAQGTSSGLVNVMDRLAQQMDENSIDPLVSGQQASGDPTATEVRAIIGSAEQMKGLTEKLYGEFLIELTHLRIPNLYWFLANDDKMQVVIPETKIKGGRIGNKYIIITSLGDIPSPMEILKNEIAMENKGEDAEYIYLNKDRMNDYRYHITLSAQQKLPRNSASRLQKVMQKYQLYAQNPIIDQRENTKRLIEAVGDTPEQLLTEERAPKTMDAMMTQLPENTMINEEEV